MQITRNLLLCMAFTLVAAPSFAQPVNCKAPNVLVVFDVSGSMGLPIAGTKYTQAVDALTTATASLDDKIRFGLLMFPEPGGSGCDLVTTPQIGMALSNANNIYNLLDPAGSSFWGGPTATHDTPMFQALTAAAQLPELQTSTRRHYVLLVTDGMQDCCISGDYDSDPDCLPNSLTLDPVEAQENIDDLVDVVSAMAGADVQTFVVGFGQNVDPLSLNQMAISGQTQKPGCNEAQTDSAALDNCYYNASNEAALESALLAISQIVIEESCDGIDNDCDGATDEDFGSLGLTCDGSDGDFCATGQFICSDDTQSVQCDEPGLGYVDLCNGLDEDCDGETDEDFTDLGAPCDGTDDDECKEGVYVCAASEKQVECSESGPGNTESCNGADDDCDGLTDEGTLCGRNQVCDAGECVSTRDDSPGDASASGDISAVVDAGSLPDIEDNPGDVASDSGADVLNDSDSGEVRPVPVPNNEDIQSQPDIRVSGSGRVGPPVAPVDSDGGCGCKTVNVNAELPLGPLVVVLLIAVAWAVRREKAGLIEATRSEHRIGNS